MKVLAILAVVYAAAYAAVRLGEPRLLYFPDRTLGVPPAELGLDIDRVELSTSDGVTLVAWVARAEQPQSGELTPRWLIICHGNGGNIAAPGRMRQYAALRRLGLNVLAFDYRGYGESSGAPSESGLYADAEAAYRYLRERLAVPPDRILLFGHSLGSAVAIDLAARAPIGGLIVEGALTSVVDRAQEIYPWAPVRWLPFSRFAGLEKVGRVSAPKLFLHATADAIIPIAHGRRVYEAAIGPKTFVELRGGHNDAFAVDSARYFGSIAEFLARLPL
ncbi:MAG: alpha/beta hydrolase [Gemmatimonadaceae bacterium]|nr:alpha/beta hydrolase [Gemmatimonadaceae bacterium]